VVEYDVEAERGPPHERIFDVVAMVAGDEVGRGSGRSKKHAEQEAAKRALDALHPTDASD
jgi:ribonuclease-3